MKNPETTLEELVRVREELRGTRVAMIALCKADDAYWAQHKIMMSSQLSKSLDAMGGLHHVEIQRNAAITLCVELGRSLLDSGVVAGGK